MNSNRKKRIYLLSLFCGILYLVGVAGFLGLFVLQSSTEINDSTILWYQWAAALFIPLMIIFPLYLSSFRKLKRLP